MKKMLMGLAIAAALLAPLSSPAQFAGVSNGNPPVANCPTPTLYLDQTTPVLYDCGNTHTLTAQQVALAAVSSQTAVTSVTTAQTMYSLALAPAFQNTAGRTIRLCGYGIYTTPGTTTPTLTLQVVEGGITPVAITTAALSSTASTNMPFQFCFDLTTVAVGSSGTLEAHGQMSINISANTPAAAEATYDDTNTAVSSAINLTATNTLLVQVAGSSSISSVQLRQLTIELIS